MKLLLCLKLIEEDRISNFHVLKGRGNFIFSLYSRRYSVMSKSLDLENVIHKKKRRRIEGSQNFWGKVMTIGVTNEKLENRSNLADKVQTCIKPIY